MKQDASSNRSSIRRPGPHQHARIANLALAVGLSLALVLLLAVTVAAARPTDLDDTATGTVIVQFDDRDLTARAITFTAPISGLRALELSGLEVITTSTSFGVAVCSIGGVGCPADNCFCGGDRFWGYKYWDGSAWLDYAVGAADSTLDNGAVEGWRWGEWGSAMWPAPPVTASLQALDWLRPLQSLTDGGYGNDSGSAEALLSIGAYGYRAEEWRRQADAPSLASYWLGRAQPYSSQGAAQAGKLAIGMIAADVCRPRGAVQPGDYYDDATGMYAESASAQSLAILGDVALGDAVPPDAVTYLKSLAQPNGGWEWGPGWGTDTNATALALQALIAVGEPLNSSYVADGLAYLKSAQNADGGFPYDPDSAWDTSSDTNSTAYVLQALRAANEDPTGSAWSIGQNNPVSFLMSLQLADGSFEWQPGAGSNLLATQQAVTALSGEALPLRIAEATTCPTFYFPFVSRQN